LPPPLQSGNVQVGQPSIVLGPGAAESSCVGLVIRSASPDRPIIGAPPVPPPSVAAPSPPLPPDCVLSPKELGALVPLEQLTRLVATVSRGIQRKRVRPITVSFGGRSSVHRWASPTLPGSASLSRNGSPFFDRARKE